MILSATLSKPARNCTETLGKPYIRIKIKPAGTSPALTYFAEFFTEKQAFHQILTEQELDGFLKQNAGITFLNCIYRTETEEITILGNRKGHITRLSKLLPAGSGMRSEKKERFENKDFQACCTQEKDSSETMFATINRIKKHILQEGIPIPFLVCLGIMTPEGKVIASKYDKFRQINRFLEYIDDILPEVVREIRQESDTSKLAETETLNRPLRIADFGCGKSYLTFAVYYYLTKVKKLPVSIIGLDLKEDVILYCNQLAEQFGYTGLHFAVGDIAGYKHKESPDVVITLHACDTATDYAIGYAIKQKAKAILSVPCCQHELNQQIDAAKKEISENSQELASLLRYGIIRERFAALATDTLRAEYLEQSGYSVQILEFIDMTHTSKNLLIRAVLKKNGTRIDAGKDAAHIRAKKLTDVLHVSPTLRGLLQD